MHYYFTTTHSHTPNNSIILIGWFFCLLFDDWCSRWCFGYTSLITSLVHFLQMHIIHGTASNVYTMHRTTVTYIRKALTIRNLINSFQWTSWKKESNSKEQKDVFSYNWKYNNIFGWRHTFVIHLQSTLLLPKEALLWGNKLNFFHFVISSIDTNYKFKMCASHDSAKKKKRRKNLFWLLTFVHSHYYYYLISIRF